MTSSSPSSHLKLSLASLTALLGTGASIYLSQLYYKIHSGTSGFQSMCNLGKGMSCNAVAISRWAELIPGLPLSSVTAGWFVAILMLTLIARVADWRRDVAKIGAWMSGFGVLYGLFMLGAMFVSVKSICVFCLAIDAATLILFFLFLSMSEGSLFKGVSSKRVKSAGILAAACIFVMIVILRPAEPATGSRDEAALLADSVLNAKVENVSVPATSPVLGRADAPITVVEFSDFQCPYCSRAAVILDSVMARYPGKIRVVFRNFPLDGACNREMKGSMHAFACALARSTVCAHKQGKFEEAYEKIFDQQPSLDAKSAIDLPVSVGVNADQLKACIDSEETKSLVGADIEEAIALKIQSTPTLFVNGRRMEGAYPIEVWDRIVAALAK